LLVRSIPIPVSKYSCSSDKLLEKDVAKERISKEDAVATRARLTSTLKMSDLSDVDFVIEAVPV